MFIQSLPPTVQAFHDASSKLANVKEHKEYRKLSIQALNMKRKIIPSEMAEAINQIEDEVLRGKVAGIVSFDMGEKCMEGVYATLYSIMKLYPKDLYPEDEPNPKDVYLCLIELGYTVKQASKMSTIQDDDEEDDE